MRITEVPTTLSPDGRNRAPHLRSWRDGWRHLRFLLLYSPRWLFLYPGILLILVGLAAGIWVIPGPRVVGGVAFDVHTLVYAAASIILGFNSVSFAFFTKFYAINTGLLPEDPRFKKLSRVFVLETGLLIGFLLIAAGLGGSVWALSDWGAHAFGPLDPTRTLRIVVPASLALTLGSQIVLASFFLSVLYLNRRRPSNDAPAIADAATTAASAP